MVTLTKKYESGRVFVRMDLSFDYTNLTRLLVNSSGADYDLQPGQPMTGAALTVQGGEAAVTGILLTSHHVPNGASKRVAVVEHGQGVVLDSTMLPTVDLAAAAFNMTTLTTRLITLGFVLHAESTQQEVQTS